ncbi:MAG: hypothetical protein ACREDP_17610, partial [Bradyrhizobium sp.]
MTSTTRFGWIRLPLLVAGFSLAAVLAVAAQTPPADDEEEATEEAATAPDAAAAPDINDPDIMKDIDVSKLDWSQLDLDTVPLYGPVAKSRAASKAPASAE